jgi:hypothetical protein
MGEEDKGPEMHHDHGHLDDGHGNIDPSKRRAAGMSDYIELAKWIAKLEVAEAVRPDLVDGTAAYRHFLFGKGATRDIGYERYITNDTSGQRLLTSAMDDLRDAAIQRSDADVQGKPPAAGTQSYHIRTAPIGVGNDARYPYAATENWQKAIGAHSIWIEANVTVETIELRSEPPPPGGVAPAGSESIPTFQRNFTIDMTIHAEDMYNFNPGATDIATDIPDSANGRFEQCGLGQEYLNRGTYTRNFTFATTMQPHAAQPGGGGPVEPGRAPREGRPGDRRPYPTTR